MYAVARRISPAQLHAVAAQLYVELLRGGYTQVCEFHYLQHARDGRPYADPLALSWALADAAAEAGIGLTCCRCCTSAPASAQPRCATSSAASRSTPTALGRAPAHRAPRAGRSSRPALAIHSLRAAAPASIARLRALAEGFDGPIHIHVAEQQREVEDCLAATGARPIEWLAREGLLDARWQLVHATHATRGRSTPSPRPAPASCCARAPRPTSATA